MKLRNKKTGDIVEFSAALLVKDGKNGEQPAHLEYPSLEATMEEWEEYKEPKDHWYINYQGELYVLDPNAVPEYSRNAKQIGNYFSSREEAEKAVEKLKAWKRLKDKGVRIGKRSHGYYGGEMFWVCPNGTGVSDKQIWLDLDLLFGGEE